MSVAIVAALPREIALLVRGTKADAALLKQGIHLHVLPGAVVVAAGMGAARAALAVRAAMAAGRVETLLSVGLAGGCLPLISAGSVLEASVVVDVNTGEKWDCRDSGIAEHHVVLATSSAIAGVREKARLAASYGAVMVDMEAATVARLAAMHGVGFRALKGISDAHDFELASLGRFTSKHGHFRTGRFALHTAARPLSWRKTIRLGRHSAQALAALTARLRQELHLTG